MCVSSIFWLWRDRRRRWWFQRAGAAIAFNDLLFTRRLHHSLSTVLPLIEDVTTLLNARHERTFSVSLTFSFRGRNFTFILAICCCHSGYCIFSKLTNERNHLVINVRNRLFFLLLQVWQNNKHHHDGPHFSFPAIPSSLQPHVRSSNLLHDLAVRWPF